MNHASLSPDREKERRGAQIHQKPNQPADWVDKMCVGGFNGTLKNSLLALAWKRFALHGCVYFAVAVLLGVTWENLFACDNGAEWKGK